MNERPPSARLPTQAMLILTVALVSLGGAWLLFYLAAQGGLWGTVNKGSFVDPPRTVARFDLRTESGDAFATGGQWWLWIVIDDPCADACQHALHQLRQIHVLLHKDAPRVRRALLATVPVDAALLAPYPQLEVLSGNLAGLEEGIYIVDPIGNLVLYYPLRDAGEPVLDDLERLLEVSQIG